MRGRGASTNPANRFESLSVDPDPDEQPDDEVPALTTRFYRDFTRTIIAHNDSPDVGFESSVNPYRGCEHGCIYCMRGRRMNISASPPDSISRAASW